MERKATVWKHKQIGANGAIFRGGSSCVKRGVSIGRVRNEAKPDVRRMKTAMKELLYCPDCGEKLDIFGICPLADPDDARRMTAPVSCGLSPAEATEFVSIVLEGEGLLYEKGVLATA